jgi:predicted enzyme involved in methoxymalonyl-ACP biosynthesis
MQLLKDKLGKLGVNFIYLRTRKETLAKTFYKKIGYRVSNEDVTMIHEW